MSEGVTAYPLAWPAGRPRTKSRQRAAFGRQATETRTAPNGTYTFTSRQRLTIADSRDRLRKELDRLGARSVVISSNLELRLDGQPRSGQREPDDPGVAVYFRLNGAPHCICCDKWDRAADNLAAVAKYIEALRGQLRWGVATAAEAFAGFRSLPGAIVTPEQMTVEQAAAFVCQWGSGTADALLASHGDFRRAYAAAVKRLHPDANGGQQRPEWHQLQQAKDLLERYHAKGGA